MAAGLRDWIDFGVICGLLLLNAVVGYWQERTAGSIVDELKKTLALKATVVRDGRIGEVDAQEIVPGDIEIVEEGTVVPVDCRIVSPDGFVQVDQSAITGESLVVDKRHGDSCFASSVVKRGDCCRVVVTDIGDKTYVGRAAAVVKGESNGRGHFTEVLEGIGTALLGLVVVTLLGVWIASFYRSNGTVDILRFTLGITIVGVPVGLPAVVTTTMTVGAAFLARKKAIVQNLSAIESLAGVEVLCSDKTGTLTRNQLSLGEPCTVAGFEADELVLTACLAASRRKKGIDAIDKAFLKALGKYPQAKSMLRTYEVVDFCPFDPVSKKVTAVAVSAQGERIRCVKGAPLAVLSIVEEDGLIGEEVRTAYKDKVAEFAARGFRSLGVARKREKGAWEIAGIMPCSDPPRHDSARTIEEAERLGLSVKMLTGDAVGIARETARQLGMGTNIYDAERLGLGDGSMTAGPEVEDVVVQAADGFAGVFPQHKYDCVKALQQRGYLTAMTGDGVNDAPSLRRADTGIAVEGSSEAARSAADIVFVAPGLSAIVDAVKTSRQIFHRMHGYVEYRIALSVHLEVFLGLWMVILNRSLRLELVVFVAILADVATLAIAYDRAPYSRRPVKWNVRKLWTKSVVLGVVLAGGSWIGLTTVLARSEEGGGGGIVEGFGQVDGVVFLQIGLTESWLIFVTRAKEQGRWGVVPSWQLVLAVLAADVAATVVCVFGWFGGGATSMATVVRVWVFSAGVVCVCGGAGCLLDAWSGSDLLKQGRRAAGLREEREGKVEDVVMALGRLLSTQTKGGRE